MGGGCANPCSLPVRSPTCLTDGITVFIELGAHPVLVASISEIAQARGQTRPPSSAAHRDEPQQADLLQRARCGVVCRASVDWPQLSRPGRTRTSRCLSIRGGRSVIGSTPQTHVRAELMCGQPTFASQTMRVLGWLYGLELGSRSSHRRLPMRRQRSGSLPGDDERHSTSLAAVLTGRATSLIDLDTALRESRSHLAVLAGNDADVACLPVRVLQAVLRSPSRPRLWFVAWRSRVSNDRVSVEQAACGGGARGWRRASRFVGRCCRCRIVVRRRGDAGLTCSRPGGEDQVVLRDGRRYALRARARQTTAPAGPIWRTDSTNHRRLWGLGFILSGQWRRRAYAGSFSRAAPRYRPAMRDASRRPCRPNLDG